MEYKMKPIAYQICSRNKKSPFSIGGEWKRITILTTYDFIQEEVKFMNYKYPEDEHWIEYRYDDIPDWQKI
jgi:hypothetical protein